MLQFLTYHTVSGEETPDYATTHENIEKKSWQP